MANIKGQLLAPDANILPPSNDRIFKVLLTHPDAKQILIDIISEVIQQKVTKVQIRNVELPVMNTDEKEERFDTNCELENGDQVNVEMHSTRICDSGKTNRSFINKYTYFMTDLHSSQKSKGVKYANLVRTYQITFTSFPVFSRRLEFINWFSLRDNNGRLLTDQINLVIIELSKLKNIIKKPVEELTSFEKWLLFLRFAPDTMQRNKINDIIKGKEEIGMAAALLQEISRDEKERAILHSRKMAEMDRVSNMLTSEEIGEIRERKKWKRVVADQKAEIERLRAMLEKR